LLEYIPEICHTFAGIYLRNPPQICWNIPQTRLKLGLDYDFEIRLVIHLKNLPYNLSNCHKKDTDNSSKKKFNFFLAVVAFIGLLLAVVCC